MDWVTFFSTAGSLLGGVSLFEWWKAYRHRRHSDRKAAAEATAAEAAARAAELDNKDKEIDMLHEMLEQSQKHAVFLQDRLAQKEERFIDQTSRLRAVQDELARTVARVNELELERATTRCIFTVCPKRTPPTVFTPKSDEWDEQLYQDFVSRHGTGGS